MIDTKRIRVLVVDDSLLFRTTLSLSLSECANIEVVGVAANANEARAQMKKCTPDVMTLDVQMPGMDGITFLKSLNKPIPVVIVSSCSGIVFDALRAGAIDFMGKPAAGKMNEFISDLVRKIELAYKLRHEADSKSDSDCDDELENAIYRHTATKCNIHEKRVNAYECIAIGASTGGTEATSAILQRLPAKLPAILITQHMPPNFTRMYAARLNAECAINVTEAKNGTMIQRGNAYVARGDNHLRVVRAGNDLMLSVKGKDKVNGHCPSVDVMFNSIAQVVGAKAMGILLTGMGADGARGMLEMKEKGAYTIAQDSASSVVYGMPKEAMKLGGVVKQMPLDAIADAIISRAAYLF